MNWRLDVPAALTIDFFIVLYHSSEAGRKLDIG